MVSTFFNCCFIVTLLSVASFVGPHDTLAASPDTQTAENAADPKLQALIQEVYEAMPQGDPGKFHRHLGELRKAAGSDKAGLVNQLLVFASRSNVQDMLRAYLVLDRLELSDSVIVRALVPHLTSTNSSLRSFALNWLKGHDGRSRWSPNRPLEPLNFSEYGKYIRNRVRKNEEVPTAFVEYIFSREPGHALLAFYYAHEGPNPKQRNILWSEHVVSNAIWMKENGFEAELASAKAEAVAQLKKLSEQDQWWVRLYVAKIMDYPDLQLDSIRERLSNDENELVRRAVANLKQNDSLRPPQRKRDGGTGVKRLD